MKGKKTGGRDWPKGKSGNPGGRPRGLARLVREVVGDDLEKLIKAQLAIALGRKPPGLRHLPAIKASDMTKAAEWLSDRGWGKAPLVVNLEDEQHEAQMREAIEATRRMTLEELEQLVEAERNILQLVETARHRKAPTSDTRATVSHGQGEEAPDENK